MADIKINDIKPAGIDLFVDDESLLNELNSDELGIISGGAGNSTKSIGCEVIIKSLISNGCGAQK